MALDQFISPFIASQFPRIYREEGPAFIQFVKAYYEWMEEVGQTTHEAKKLLEYRDIDATSEEFLEHFKNKYMVGIPEGVLGDKRTLQKHIKEIYSSKGTAQGLELLFRLLYNEPSEIYLPGDDILRPSDGVWTQPVYLEVTVNPYNVLLVGEKITGRESGATAIVEDFQTRYINRRQINVLFLSNLRGDFKTNEILLSDVIDDPLTSPSIIGSASRMLINESGFGFKVGDVLEFGEGSGQHGKAIVSSVVPRNGAVSFTIASGGSGYPNNNPWAESIVTITAVDPDNPGIGADFRIGDIVDTEVIRTAVDAIAPYANTPLNSPDYQFPTNVGQENINTPLDQALNVQDITVGTIKTLRAINPGQGYNGPVFVTVENPVIAGLMIRDSEFGDYKGNNAHIEGKASAGNGAIESVKIINSGIGYANGDVVTLINDNVPFIAGGTILLEKQGVGEGYWKDNRSFLNSDKYIQDSFYYQEYSYETRLSVAFDYYADLLQKLWHPAGTQGFGKVVISTIVDNESEAVEVDIVATRITEYMTTFGTHVTTTRATASKYATTFGTEYITLRPTLTSRNTYADYLINQPNLIINGEFPSTLDNWTTSGNVSWNAGAAVIEVDGGEGSISQTVTVVPGDNYQLEWEHAELTGTIIASVSHAGVTFGSSNNSVEDDSGTLRFQAPEGVTTIDVALSIIGPDGTSAIIDAVKLRNVYTLARQTEFSTVFVRDTAVSAPARSTTFATNTTYDTSYDTEFVTTFDSYALKNTEYATQRFTDSTFSVSRATDRATTTRFDTVFLTNRETSKVTATSFITAFLTDRATTTSFVTTFNTTFDTARATTTGFATTYDTLFDTHKATTTEWTTSYGTTKTTNHATRTSYGTSRATDTSANTSRATATVRATNRATTTAYVETVQTSRATNTTRQTNYVTTFGTGWVSARPVVYNTTYVTHFEVESWTWTGWDDSRGWYTWYGDFRNTSRSTTRYSNVNVSRDTSRETARSTAFPTNTTWGTLYDRSRSTTTTFNTTFNTTTIWVTTWATNTTFETGHDTTTTYVTSDAASRLTTRETITAFGTNRTTTGQTSRITDTVFTRTQSTSRITNRDTMTQAETSNETAKNTISVYDTVFETNRSTVRSTSTMYNTLFITATTRLTDLLTNRSTTTAVPGQVGRLTSRVTSKSTNRATDTSRLTGMSTIIGTTIVRDTNRLTVFVAYPTSFLTNYETLTEVSTTYQTERETERETMTVYDTEYPTERQTSVWTQTDVAD